MKLGPDVLNTIKNYKKKKKENKKIPIHSRYENS